MSSEVLPNNNKEIWEILRSDVFMCIFEVIHLECKSSQGLGSQCA